MTSTALFTRVTIYLDRLPVGDWVCLDAVSHTESNGISMAASTLYDERGLIGQAAQSLVIDTR
jgi:hypothetical protein